LENPPEAGILPEAVVKALDGDYQDSDAERRASASAASSSSSSTSAFPANGSGLLYPPSERGHIRDSWRHLMRWSRAWRTAEDNGASLIGRLEKVLSGQHAMHAADVQMCAGLWGPGLSFCMHLQVVVFGGGSFGTAMACALASQKSQLKVTLLLRDPYVCKGINERHVNTRYLKV
jgi:glycerol-3-phosphate dehydrogenase (NAD+)